MCATREISPHYAKWSKLYVKGQSLCAFTYTEGAQRAELLFGVMKTLWK